MPSVLLHCTPESPLGRCKAPCTLCAHRCLIDRALTRYNPQLGSSSSDVALVVGAPRKVHLSSTSALFSNVAHPMCDHPSLCSPKYNCIENSNSRLQHSCKIQYLILSSFLAKYRAPATRIRARPALVWCRSAVSLRLATERIA